MKRFLIAVMFGLMTIAAQAEASFDQIEGLIQQKNYAAAEAGLEVIVKNHPNSAKAFYAMAQAQAGLGNLEKAQKALNIATGLNPTLDFAPEGSVQKLKQAITPQVAKIEAVEESHTARNVMILLVLVVSGFAIWFAYGQVKIQREKEQAERDAEFLREEKARQEREAERKRQHMEMLAQQDAERKAELAAEAALKAHKNYGHERFDPSNPDKLKSVKQFKEEQLAAAMVAQARAEAAEAKARADRAEMDARLARSNASSGPAHTTVVNNSNDGLLTGILIGDMMNHHSHDTTRVVEREVIREVPASSSSRSSSWDDTPSSSSSRSSSWDDSSSSSSSSSWSSSSSSDSSSSWSSSSSDSGSSSSWD
jgi:hypothetical protein